MRSMHVSSTMASLMLSRHHSLFLESLPASCTRGFASCVHRESSVSPQHAAGAPAPLTPPPRAAREGRCLQSSTATTFCQFPIATLERGRPTGNATGTHKDRHVSSNKAKKKGYTSTQDRFFRCPIYRQSQLEIGWTEDHCARLGEIAAVTLLRRPSEHDAKTLGFWCLTVQDRTDP